MDCFLELDNAVDAFFGRPTDKLWKMSWLSNGDYALQLAIDSILYYYFGYKENSYTELNDRDWLIDIRYELKNYMRNCDFLCRILDTLPLHVCYDLIIRPFRQFINGLIERYRKGNYAD